jgi:hypothetical protein
VGRASRKRAEQRRNVLPGQPLPLERSEHAEPDRADVPAERPERLRNGRPERLERRAPFRRPPPHAYGSLIRLEELCRARARLEDAITSEVAALTALGTDWGTIGRALGVSRQAARQRYGDPTP